MVETDQEILNAAVPVIISLEGIFFIALIYGAIGGLIDSILSRHGRKTEINLDESGE